MKKDTSKHIPCSQSLEKSLENIYFRESNSLHEYDSFHAGSYFYETEVFQDSHHDDLGSNSVKSTRNDGNSKTKSSKSTPEHVHNRSSKQVDESLNRSFPDFTNISEPQNTVCNSESCSVADEIDRNSSGTISQKDSFSYCSENIKSIDDLNDFEKVKDRIFIKIMNTEKSKPMSDDICCIPFMDLSIFFYYFLGSESDQFYSVSIKASVIEKWNISVADLFKLALENTKKKLGFKIDLIQNVLLDMMNDKNFKDNELCAQFSETLEQDIAGGYVRYPMYVISNNSNYFGASTILYSEVLETFADQLGSDFYILPSSIHELILVPAEVGIVRSELKDIVHEINTTEIPESDFLSDNVYMYSRKLRRVVM